MADAHSESRPRLASANAIYATLSAASAVFMLALQSLISHLLGETVFGRFSWALTLAMFGEALMDLGVHQVTIRSIARDPSRATHLFRNSLALKAVSGAAMFLIMGGMSYLLARDTALWQASLVMLGVAVLRSYLLTIRGVLQGLERFGRDCAVVVVDRLLVLIITGAAVLTGAGLFGIAVSFLLARVLAVGLALSITRPDAGNPKLGFDLALWRDLQREAFPIGLFLVVLNFYSYVDTIMLGVISTFSDTGLYSNAYRLYEGLFYAPGILSALLTPRLANLWKDDRAGHLKLAQRSLLGALALAAVLALPVWLLARPLLVVVFGEPAADAVTALRLLLLGLGPVFAIWILHAVAISVFRERLLLTTTSIGAIVNAGLNLWLIPRYGRDGAALATVAGEVLTLTLLLWGLRPALWSQAERS